MSTISDSSVSPSIESGDPIVTLPPAGREDVRSVLAFGLYKSGSTLLESVIHEMARQIGVAPYNPDADLWNSGIKLVDAPKDMGDLFHEFGYCYGVFRQVYRPYKLPILDTNRSVLQIRDPRDMLVSHYYSVSRSHPRPPADGNESESFDLMREETLGRSVDDHALKMQEWVWCQYRDTQPLLENPLCRIFRYEDIIFNKATWIKDLARHLGWHELSTESLDTLASVNDIRPEIEQPSAHIRSVTPGDHKRKLKPDTIAQLNETFADILDRFDYEH